MNKVTKVLDVIGGASMMIAVFAMVINIILRIFNLSLTGTYEIVQYTALLFASTSVPICVLERAHITVDVVTMRLPAISYRVLEIISGIINIIAYIILAYAGYVLAFKKISTAEVSDTLHFPIGPLRLFWAVCVTLVVILSVIQLIQTMKSKPLSRAERQAALKAEADVDMNKGGAEE